MRKLYVILALVIFCGVAEASKRFPLTVSSIVPGARGHVTVDKDKNGNARVNMEVEFLANPQNLTPPAEVYIVWIQDRNGRPENQGQLKVSKDLKGSFETVTPSKNFELFVTGERDYQVKEPAGPEVLRTTIQP